MLFPTVPVVPPPPTITVEDESNQPRFKLLRNDHNQAFVDTGEPPSNFVREADPSSRFAQYPRWSKLIQAKSQVHQARTHPPQWLKCDLNKFDLTSLGVHFDVILIDPPWEEYVTRTSNVTDPEDKLSWSLESLKNLQIPAISETPSFIFIWAGATHLDEARTLLQHWGFRRCEDITWIKTTQVNGSGGLDHCPATRLGDIPELDKCQAEMQQSFQLESRLLRLKEWMKRSQINKSGSYSLGLDDDQAILKKVKEHCLMGLKGMVRRSQDSHIVHTNIDTDLIVDSMPLGRDDNGLISTAKPWELYEIIERFALGRRKLELFGTSRNVRPGWLTLGLDVNGSNFNRQRYRSWFQNVTNPEPKTGTGGNGSAWGCDNEPTTAADFLGYNSMGLGSGSQINGVFKSSLDMSSQERERDDSALEIKNAFPHLPTYMGGRYEGVSQSECIRKVISTHVIAAVEFLRPKSPPSKPGNPGGNVSVK